MPPCYSGQSRRPGGQTANGGLEGVLEGYNTSSGFPCASACAAKKMPPSTAIDVHNKRLTSANCERALQISNQTPVSYCLLSFE